MVKGDQERCPKGGWPEYMNGEWYNQRLGRNIGDLMTEENKGKYGWGAYSDQPHHFTTVEQKLSGVRKWYDKVRRSYSRVMV
jgi:hypothetical protein